MPMRFGSKLHRGTAKELSPGRASLKRKYMLAFINLGTLCPLHQGFNPQSTALGSGGQCRLTPR